MTEDLKTIEQLVSNFNDLRIKERNGATFLEIARAPHLENVWSNILSFYIDPNREHNLSDLLLKSIFETTNIPIALTSLSGIIVQTEYYTHKGNRIDIVVKAENFILGIENKVGAALYNDLEDYAATIEDIAKIQKLPTYKIVLSKHKNEPTHGFINLVYSDFIKTIRANIGAYTDYADGKYLLFFLDFLKNIENNINASNMNENLEVITFFQKNVDKVNKLLEYHHKFNTEFIIKLNNIDRLFNRIKIKEELAKQRLPASLWGYTTNRETGRFTYEGEQLIKYNIQIGEVSLFYQMGIKDYKLQTQYWFDNAKHQPYGNVLLQNGIEQLTFEYFESDQNIALEIERQLIQIFDILDLESKKEHN
ncbi:MAG: PD-(D/E)XK nuclease family protein [Bacteroidia bacterium]|nr:PD-(D/E)XK nuclease family protein [Bacteroidia bacterium]